MGVLHAKTFGAKFSWDNDKVRLKQGGGLSIFYDAGPPTPNAEPLLGKMPWLAQNDISFACTGLLPPNLTMFGRIDCIRPMIAWPLGPEKCEVLIERSEARGGGKLEIHADHINQAPDILHCPVMDAAGFEIYPEILPHVRKPFF